jgi:hypothetical protein
MLGVSLVAQLLSKNLDSIELVISSRIETYCTEGLEHKF